MTELKIRLRQPADIPELARVLVRVHDRNGYPVEGVAHPEQWVTPPGQLAAWTATYGDQIIGQMALVQPRETDDVAITWQHHTGHGLSRLAIPSRLFVDPDHREHGAGTQLAQAAFGYASELGLAIAFDVMLKDHDAIRLYENLGCQRIGLITHHHSGDRDEAAAVYVAPKPTGH